MGEIVNPALADLQALRPRTAGRDARVFAGSLRELAALAPEFERRPLAAGGEEAAARPDLQVVVRRGSPGLGMTEIPVGVVSRRQPMIPHARVIQAIERALGVARADPAQARAELELAEFGARMSLAIDFPARFDLDPGDGEPFGLRLLAGNAVHGGGLRLLPCWRRRASGSSIAVGTTRLELRLAHRLPARLVDVIPTVQQALEQRESERAALAEWRRQLVTRDQLATWANGAVRRMWGARDAARIFHVAMTGWDGEPAFGVERVPPVRRTMQATLPVPGAPAFAETVYDALLAAAWVGAEARTAEQRLDRAMEVAALMRALLRGGRVK